MTKRTAIAPLSDGLSTYAKLVAISAHRAQSLFPDDRRFTQLEGALRAKHWSRVLEITESLEIQQYSGVLDQYVKTQLVALVKKFPFTPQELPGFDPQAAAWKKFRAAEHLCKRVNQRSRLLRYGVGFPHGDVLSIMKGYIRRVLGDKPDFRKIYDQCDWGPGASVGVTGDRTNLGRKFSASEWTCTPLALSYATQALWSQDQLRRLLLDEVGGIVCLDRELFAAKVKARVKLVTFNNISFVPKTFKTHRSIASEPLLNGYLQKGVDKYMRQLLAGVGLDLRDQLSNQEMAREGSCEGFNPYATIDLSSASDSMSYGIVKTLLPAEWFEFLDSIRSHQYRFRGVLYTYEKFVSMGNGFCFPLQTLLFSAAAYAICKVLAAPVDFRVYGDDIIVRQSEALYVLEVLKYMGFRTNLDKTFITGPFRESCGADWYRGLDIRPVYVDYRFGKNTDLYKFHNSCRSSTLTMGFFGPLFEKIREQCPPSHRFVRPVHGNADSAFTVEKDVAMSSKYVVWNRDTWAWKWTEVQHTPVRDHITHIDPALCCVLEYLAVLRGSSSSVPLAVRRKSRAQLRRKSYWALPGEIPWKGADPDRDESPY